jgi:hypothetical protein
MKKSHKFSFVSTIPAAFTSFRTALHMFSLSSGVMRSGMNPLERRSLMYTKKRSFTICESVIKNVTGVPLTPAFVYNPRRSVLKSTMPYEDVTEI